MNELAKANNTYVGGSALKPKPLPTLQRKAMNKLDLLSNLNDGEITFYTQGNFTDLCAGRIFPAQALLKHKAYQYSRRILEGATKRTKCLPVFMVSPFPRKRTGCSGCAGRS